MTSLEFQSEMLARAVEQYLFARYSCGELRVLLQREIQSDDLQLARQLYNWRFESTWEYPDVIGAERCVECHKIMGDASSAFSDETVCADCADDDDSSTPHPERAES